MCRAVAPPPAAQQAQLESWPWPGAPPCLQGFNQGTPPIACPLARNASVVHRWFSGDEQGTLTASSCGNTTGDPVIQVLSSPNPAGGPWRCEGSQDDDGERRGLAAQQAGGRWPYAGQGAAHRRTLARPADTCPSNSATVGAFRLAGIPFQQRRYYFFATAALSTEGLPALRLTVTKLTGGLPAPRRQARRPRRVV